MPCGRMLNDIVSKTQVMNVRIGLVGCVRQLNMQTRADEATVDREHSPTHSL